MLNNSKALVRWLMLIFIILTLFFGIFSLIQLSNLNQKAQILSYHNLPKARLSVFLRINLTQLQRVELRFLLANDIDEKKSLENQIKSIAFDISGLLNQYQSDSDLTPNEEELLNNFSNNWHAYLELQQQFMQREYQDKQEINQSDLLRRRLVFYHQMVRDCTTLMDINSKLILRVSEAIAKTYQRSKDLIILSMLISMLVGSIVMYLFQRQLNQQKNLQDQADRDSLTGLYNRRYLLLKAEETFREHGKMSLIMADIDHFKKINDKYGHDGGDEALRALARQMISNLRLEDIVARYGGEEFIILLPDTTLASAYEIAERLRQQTSRLICHSDQGENFSFTLSLGVTERRDGTDSLNKLFREVDKCLYYAKNHGRNRVVTIDHLKQ